MRSLMLLVLVMGCTPEVHAQPAQAGKPVPTTVGPPPPVAPSPLTPATPSPRTPVAPSPQTPASPSPLTLPTPTPPGSPTTPRPPLIGPRDHHPVGAIHIPCTVRADVEARVYTTQVRAKLVLRNLDAHPATVTLKTSCPAGPIELVGLPDEFDPMHGCRKRCSGETSTVTYKIPARGTLKLGETVLRAKGDACNPPLPLGSTFLRAEVVTEPRQLEVCSGAGVHIVRDHKTKRLRRAGLLEAAIPAVLPPPPPPAKPAVVPPPPPAPKKQAPTKPCPVCAFACLNGVPSRRTDANGCSVCACDDFGF